MSFRKELKYLLTSYEVKLLKSKFLKVDYQSPFPLRRVNSCYFDTHNLDLFRLSLDGIYPRKKVRLRWYNENHNFCLKEQKISSIEGRHKLSKNYGKIKQEEISDISFFDQEHGLLKPIILITYTREYFLYKDLRFTFDFNIKYIDISGIIKKTVNETNNVIEVKTNLNTSDDYINCFLGKINSGFSKYTRGIISLNKDIY